MKRLVVFPSKYGDTVVEIDEPEPVGGEERAARWDGVIEKVDQEFDMALKRIQPAVRLITESLNDFNNPDEITVEFGIKMSAKAGAVIASADAEANFTIKISWKKPAPPRSLTAPGGESAGGSPA
jgi:hypothetical protein